MIKQGLLLYDTEAEDVGPFMPPAVEELFEQQWEALRERDSQLGNVNYFEAVESLEASTT